MKSLARLRALLGGLLAALCAGTAAWAAPYPEHPVRLVVPYPAGGATDGAIRVLAERLGAAWGQPVIVDNRAGASGRLGLALVAKSPHSYNFVAATNSTISDELTRGGDGSFLLARDLVPVVTIFTTPVALLVHTGTGVDSMAQYIALAQRRPGAVSFGSSGEGTSTHFYGELLKRYHGPDFVIDAPYAIEWAYIPHFYSTFYVYQYATSISAGTWFAHSILNGGEAERERYLDVLRAGGSADPVDILKKAGLDMTAPDPYRGLVADFKATIDEIETLMG